MEFRKMVTTTLYVRQQKRHRCNRILLHKSSKQSSLVSGPRLNSSPGAKNPSVFRGSATTFQNAGLDEAQAGIKIAERNINNFRYADDTTLMAKAKKN